MIYSASEARAVALDKRAIFDEIAIIEPLVLDAIAAGALTMTIGPAQGGSAPSTSMTADEDYYNAYTNSLVYVDAASTKMRAQMNEVIKYFQSKDYVVRVARHNTTSTFNWIIKW